MIYDTLKGIYHQGIILPVYFNHTRDIYRYFILDEVLKLPHSRLAKNQAQVNAFEICLQTHPTQRKTVIGVDLHCKFTPIINIKEIMSEFFQIKNYRADADRGGLPDLYVIVKRNQRSRTARRDMPCERRSLLTLNVRLPLMTNIYWP